LNKILISEKEYHDKVYACWLGKNIGGTLGAPVSERYAQSIGADGYAKNAKEAVDKAISLIKK